MRTPSHRFSILSIPHLEYARRRGHTANEVWQALPTGGFFKGMNADPLRTAFSFTEEFGNPKIAGYLAADYRRTRIGRVLSSVESRLGDGVERSGPGAVRDLRSWAAAERISQSVVAEVYIDYWFLYTVLDSGADHAIRSGVPMGGFLGSMNRCFDGLRRFCTGVVAPRLGVEELRPDELRLAFETPRPSVPGLIPGFISRTGRRFLVKTSLRPEQGHPFPTWRLRI